MAIYFNKHRKYCSQKQTNSNGFKIIAYFKILVKYINYYFGFFALLIKCNL